MTTQRRHRSPGDSSMRVRRYRQRRTFAGMAAVYGYAPKGTLPWIKGALAMLASPTPKAPSEAQVAYAGRVAQTLGVPLPDIVQINVVACFLWTLAHQEVGNAKTP